MSMYNLLECSENYSKTSGSLWNYYRDEANVVANKIAADYKMNNSKATASKFFVYETKITGSTSVDNNMLDTEVVAPLKYLSNVWRSVDLPLVNYEIELDLSGSKDCIISELLSESESNANSAPNLPIANLPEASTTGATLQIAINFTS